MSQDGFNLDGAVAAVMQAPTPQPKYGSDEWMNAVVQHVMQTPEPSFGQKALSAAQGVGVGLAGAAKSVLSDYPRELALGIAGTAADVLGRPRPDESSMLKWDPASAIGKGAEKVQGALTPDNPLLRAGAPFQTGAMAGQSAPTLLLMAVDPTLAAVAGSTQVSGDVMAAARASGASPEATLAAGAGGYVAGGALTGGVATAIESISARGGGALARSLSRIGAGAGAGVTLPILTNAIHNWATDDEIPLFQNAKESGLFGAALGALFSAATEGALKLRERTGRRYTTQGWDGALLPEDAPMQGDAEHPLAQAGVTANAGLEAQAEGAALRDKQAAIYANHEPGPEPQAVQPQRARPQEPTTGDPIYHPVTGEYLGNEELPPKVAPPIPDNRKPVPGKPRDIMQAPQDEPNTTGIRRTPDESSPESTQIAPYNPPFKAPTKTRDVTKPIKQYSEPGMEIPRDESLLYAPISRPDYTKLANPVTDPTTGNTIVTDIGTPTNRGTGLRVTLNDTYKAHGTILRTDVIKAIEGAGQKLGQFIIRTGLVPEGARGLYDQTQREARIAQYGDVVAAAHETGHHIGIAAFGSGVAPDRSPAWKQIEPELERLGRMLYPDTTPHNGHVSEGFAEFGYLWTLEHENLMRAAPETTKWFDGQFLEAHPEFKSALIAAREAGDQYRFQGSAKRTQPVDPTSWAMRFRTSSIGEAFSKFKRNWFESAEALYDMARKAAEAGAVFSPGTRAIDVFVAKRATADGVLEYMKNTGTIDAGRAITGDSLKSVLAPIRGQAKDFSRYLALRAQQWRNEAKTIRDFETGQRVQAAQPIQAMSVDLAHQLNELETKHPHFRGTSDAVLAWYDRVLSYVAQHDPILAQSVAAMREEGEFYMPLHRWADWYESKEMRSNTSDKRAASTGKLTERSSGSKREIVDPLTSLIQEARRAIERAHERQVQNAVISNAMDAGLVGFVSDVTNKVGSLVADDTPFKPGEVYGMPLDRWGAMQVFSTGAIQHADGPIVPFKQAKAMPDGSPGFEIRYYQLDPKLHEAVMSMDPTQAMQALGFLGSTMRFFRGTFVLGAVGLNASFGMLKNPIRDAQTLYVNSRNSPHLASLIPQLAYEHARTAAHQITAGKVPYSAVDVYDKLGLGKTDKYATFRSAASSARSLTRGGITRFVNLDTPADMVRVLSHVMQASEKATRIWELKQTAKKVGWEPGTPMTPEQAVMMAVDAKQVTVDFNAGGNVARNINQIVPFFNIAIQGPRTYLRGAKEAPGTFVLRNAALAGLGALLWYRYKDEKWMQSMPASERMRNWYFPLPDGPGGEKILARIPLSQEVAIPVKAVEFFLDGLHSKDPYTASQYVGALAQTLGPAGINPLVDELMRQAFNRKDYFESSEIVNEANQHKPVEQQVGPNTGPLAVALGEALHLSPVRIDSAIKNTLGGVGNSLSDAFGLMKGRKTKAPEASDTPLLGSLVRKGGPETLQSRNISNLYDLAEVANRNAPDKPDADSVRRKLLLDNATKVVSLTYALREAGNFTISEQQKLMSAADRVAKDAVDQINKGGSIDPSAAIRTRAQLQVQVHAARLKVGGDE